MSKHAERPEEANNVSLRLCSTRLKELTSWGCLFCFARISRI